MNSLPSAIFYPAVLIGAFWIFAPPLVTLIGAVVAFVNRHTLPGRFIGLAILTELALFLPYFHQAARFLAPAASMLIVMSAVAIPNIVKQVMERGSRSPPDLRSSRLKRCFLLPSN
jgi:hypothetical protein